MKIVVMGPQGSGKGIQSERLAKHFHLKHVSVGDILRDEAKKTSKIGKTISTYLNKGKLIPNQLNDQIIKNEITKTKDNFILDGYPRNHHQAEYLLKLTRIDAVLFIHVSDKESMRRISQRRICSATHKVYNVDEITKKDIEECKKKGGRIIRRDDDTFNTIRARIKLYHQETKPLLGFFLKNNIEIIRVNGECPIKIVEMEIRKKIKGLT